MKMKFTAVILSFILSFIMTLSGVAQTGSQSTSGTTPTRRRAATATPVRRTVTFEEFRQLQDMLQQQQQQIRRLQQELQQRDQREQQRLADVQNTAAEARARADAAAAQAAQTSQSFGSVQSTVADLKNNATTMAASIQEDQKRVSEISEHPAAIHFRGVTITPGGFIEAAGIWRNHNENASVNSASGDFSIPLGGQTNSRLSEFRFDARQSRLTLLGEGKIGSLKASGYYEVDFLGAAPTANENQSNSFNLRQRQLWGQAAFDNGLTFTGGQQWSLFTLNRKGENNRAEFLPMVINAQYVIGYDWARQPSFRVVKSFADKVWAGFAVENSSMVRQGAGFTIGGTATQNPIFGFNDSLNAQSPNGLFTLSNTPGANGISTNIGPDLVAKLAFEPGWGHWEIKGVARFFRDRFNGNNNNTTGGGGGVAAILPFVPKKLDLIAEATIGNGMGRYGSGGGFDVTLRSGDFAPIPVRTYHALAGPEIHIGKNLDIYIYGGYEYYQRTFYHTGATTGVGYGSPFANNSGCILEQTSTTSLSCGNQTRYAYEITPGFWYRFYKGPAGTLQWGAQYSYSERQLWRGLNGSSATSAVLAPKGTESQVYTSFRYYIP